MISIIAAECSILVSALLYCIYEDPDHVRRILDLWNASPNTVGHDWTCQTHDIFMQIYFFSIMHKNIKICNVYIRPFCVLTRTVFEFDQISYGWIRIYNGQITRPTSIWIGAIKVLLHHRRRHYAYHETLKSIFRTTPKNLLDNLIPF